MACGIYCYVDTENNDEIVYIGRDSHIDRNKRHKDHTQPSRYNEQVINRVIQNNPSRFEYRIIGICNKLTENNTSLNMIEMYYIEKYNPRFNFTKGGEGIKGFKFSDESRRRLRENHPKGMKGKHHSIESRKKISESLKGKKNPNYNKVFSEDTRLNMSKSRNVTGVYRVTKCSDKTKQGFSWRYQFMANGKLTIMTSVDINKLKARVLAKGLEWVVVDEEKAKANGLEV